jgi:hypothetical protein
MIFVHPLLLAGLALVGIPILLHLIMRQQPKHLLFPAMRFLLQQHRINQRKLRLRHLLLLALRILVLAAFCLALARPKVFSERLNLTADRPVAAVLIFDTSVSMEYNVAGQSRLDEAKRRALELLDELPQGSRVAVLDTAEPGGEWLVSLSQARERISALELRAANYPVTSQILPAYDLLAKLDEEADLPDEMPLRFLYVFSDRTQACWNNNQLETLQRRHDQLPPNSVHTVFVDVGVDNPAGVVLTNLEVPKQVIPANERVLLRATVQAVGIGCDTEIRCHIDGKEPLDRRPVTLEAGQNRVFTFERRGLTPGMHQAEISLATKSGLPSAGSLFATFEVQGPRRVLTVTDSVADARIWKLALGAQDAFQCDVKTPAEFRQNLFPKELAQYKAVCLLNVAKPDAEIWDRLLVYVQSGGGLAIIPGGEELNVAAYSTEAARKLMPARLVKVVAAEKPGAIWSSHTYRHPVIAPFDEWSKNETVDFLKPGLEPSAARYWEVEMPPGQEAFAIVRYGADKPALLERNFDKKTVRGRVLLFTTPLDDAHVAGRDAAGHDRPRWNTYLQTSFYLVLVQKTIGYLAGDAESGVFNFSCGQSVPVALPAESRLLNYTIDGPGLNGADNQVPRAEDQGELQITKAMVPGNYKVLGDGKPVGAFSLNLPAEESQLNRVPVEQIEALFGAGSVLPLDQKATLHDALQSHFNQPVELLPWLMILVLLVLVVENLLANKFYRREPDENELANQRPSPPLPQGTMGG